MRRTTRLLASAKPARYLEANTPTGLTGLYTHPAPRSTLIHVYSSTLDKLKQLPEDSVYRQSTEALTKQRLKVISSVVPAGYEEWAAKAKQTIAEHPEVFNTPAGEIPHDGGRHLKTVVNGKVFITTKLDGDRDELLEEWDGEPDLGPELEGTRTAAERKSQVTIGLKRPGEDEKTVSWDPEPQLNADQYVAPPVILG
jgi:NADH dehydrogenase (ubiquinone) 1 alpha subcomplex subunit 5